MAGLVLADASSASAQQPPPPAGGPPPQVVVVQPGYPPPPGYGAPPPGYGAPPPGYYAQPQPQQAMAPRELEWEPGEPITPGYHPSTKIRTGLVVGGACTFGALWIVNVFVASVAVEAHSSGLQPLFAPIVGPFIAIGTTHGDALGGFWLAFDGVVQAGGVAMLIAGIAAPKNRLLRNDISGKNFLPMPMVFGPKSGGLGFIGTM
jgi:hypothetical protein